MTETNNQKNYIRGIAKFPKQPIIYEQKDNKYYCYDGKEHKYITKEQYKEIKSLKTPYMLIPKGRRDVKLNENKKDKRKYIDKTLKELYDEFIKDSKKLFELSNGKIDMRQSGQDTLTAINYAFQLLNENKIYAEQINFDEFEFIENCSHGPLTFSENYKGELYKYDINSCYPSLYSSPYLLIPVQKGKLLKIDKKEFNEMKYFKFGIYRVIISYPDNNKKWKKLFKLNDNNYYTHYDLTYAKKLNLNIELIEDEKNNLLMYTRNQCKTASECFKTYVDTIYKIRKSNPDIKNRCKTLLNCLWGALCQKQKFKISIRFDAQETTEIFESREVISHTMFSDRFEVVTVRKEKPYLTNWARMKPFLLSKARIKISEYIEPYQENVYRCHTDSIISNIKLHNNPELKNNLEISDKLGKMKFEGYCQDAEIINVNQVIYNKEIQI